MRVAIVLLFFSASWLQAQDTTRVSLLFLGDIMQHDSQIAAAYQKERGYDYSECFQFIKPVLQSADLTIGNLELTLAGPPFKGYPQFSSPDALARTIQDVGIDVLVTANNHSMDRGRQGVERTIHVLDSMGITHTGTFRDSSERANHYPLLIERSGIRLSLLNYTFSTNGIPVSKPNIVNGIDTLQIHKDLITAEAQNPDAIIVFFHWGTEYQSQPNERQRMLAEFCFRHGARLVIGAHPHVLQPMEWRKDANQLIAYSLGNFVSGQRDRYKNGGTMLRVELGKVTTDSTSATKVLAADYELQYVYRNARKKYFILPGRLFESDTVVVKEPEERLRLKEFVDDSRKLFGKYNIGINESVRTYEEDSVYYSIAVDSISASVEPLAAFYGVVPDSLQHGWFIGTFYDHETAHAARDQIKSRESALRVRIVRISRGKREEID